ncbi:MAG: hypothetical protein OHK0046_35040 [Anaerolineae bacterium]
MARGVNTGSGEFPTVPACLWLSYRVPASGEGLIVGHALVIGVRAKGNPCYNERDQQDTRVR